MFGDHRHYSTDHRLNDRWKEDGDRQHSPDDRERADQEFGLGTQVKASHPALIGVIGGFGPEPFVVELLFVVGSDEAMAP
jgi:hypothetical protein